MATKVHHNPDFAGSRELFMLLDLLQDPEKYRTLFEELDSQRRQVNAGLEARGIASDLDAALITAQQDRAAAKRELVLAQSQASERLASAGALADEMIDAARAESARLAGEALRKLADADTVRTAISRQMIELQAREAEAAEQLASANAMLAEATEVRRQYEGKVAVLSEALAQAG